MCISMTVRARLNGTMLPNATSFSKRVPVLYLFSLLFGSCQKLSSLARIQDDLAKCVDVSRQTIVSLEKESYVPSLLLAMHLARQFKTSVEEIFYISKEEDND